MYPTCWKHWAHVLCVKWFRTAKLWTAPELLRLAADRPPEGSQKGDVYSFAVICQEVVHRRGLFWVRNMDQLSPKGISWPPLSASSALSIVIILIIITLRHYSMCKGRPRKRWVDLVEMDLHMNRNFKVYEYDVANRVELLIEWNNTTLAQDTSAIDCLKRIVPKMTNYVSRGMLNSGDSPPVWRSDAAVLLFCYWTTEIYQYVKEGQMSPAFRPTLLDSKQDSQGCSEQLASLIRRCWSEDPVDRPDFGAVKSALKRISKSVQLHARQPRLHILLLIVVVVLVDFSFFFFFRSNQIKSIDLLRRLTTKALRRQTQWLNRDKKNTCSKFSSAVKRSCAKKMTLAKLFVRSRCC